MTKNKIYNLIMIVLTMGLLTQSIFATGGYFRHGYGIKYGSMAGAGTALSLSSIGAANNPGGLALLGKTTYDVNIAYFSPSRQYTVTGNPSGFPGTFGLAPGTTESESNTFFFPSLGAAWMLNEDMAVGVILYGNGGMNTDYPTQVFHDGSSSSTGVNIEQLFVGSTFSYEFTENHAVGVTALFVYQSFSAEGLASFSNFSSDPTALTGNDNSTSTGFGARFGYQGKILPELSIGASYQLKTAMSEFDDYKGLFAEAGDFDVPATWNIGIAVTPSKGFTIAVDAQQILYSDVKSIANPMDLMANSPADQAGNPNPNFKPLGHEEGWGFGWEDVMVYKVGLLYEGLESWKFMAGYSTGDNPVPESEVMFNILAPGIIEQHMTLGVSKQINESNEITVSLMYAPSNTVSGPNPLEAPGQQTIELEMSQFQLELGWAFSTL